MKIKELLKDVEYFLLDCDGVLWLDCEIINRSDVAVQKLRDNGFKVLFVTNTSQKNSDELYVKLRKLGFNPEMEEIFCPSLAIAKYLKNMGFTKSVYVIGSVCIISELKKFDIEGFTNDDLEALESTNKTLPDIQAVILGHDGKVNDKKLNRALDYLKSKDMIFLCTGTGIPSSHLDEPVFGLGSSYTYIKKHCKTAPILLGKPSTLLFDEIQQIHVFDPSRACMIGDNICTDIRFGKKHNMKSILVLSGETYLEEYEEYMKLLEKNHEYYKKNHSVPDFVCDDMLFVVENFLQDNI